jgi:putative intracellular protease/amidase
MAKKVAILAVNPVNGLGLFHYLESFFESGIAFKVFAVAESAHIKTNSGVSLQTDDVIGNLRGKESEFDAMVFACGDAMPKFSENVGRPEYQALLAVIKAFGDAGKIVAGHCVGGLLFDTTGIAAGKRLAMHPFVKKAVTTAIASDEAFAVDGNFYTAQTESALHLLMPELVKKLNQ